MRKKIGNVLQFRVYGKPHGEPRARGVSGGTGKPYTDKSHKSFPWKHAIRRAACAALQIPSPPIVPVIPLGAPVFVDLVFVFERPLSHFVARDRLRGVLRDDAPDLHTAKPDSDNLAKAVMDALGPWPKKSAAVLWDDDSVVAQLHIVKRYTAAPSDPGVIVRLKTNQPIEVESRMWLASKVTPPGGAGRVVRPSDSFEGIAWDSSAKQNTR